MTRFARSELKIYQCSYCLMKHPHNCTDLKPAPFQTQNLYSCVCCCYFYVQGFFFFLFLLSIEDPEQKALEFLHHISEMVLPCWSSESCSYCKKCCHFEEIPEKMKVTQPIAVTWIFIVMFQYWQWFNWPRWGRGTHLWQLLQELFFEHWQWAIMPRFSWVAWMGSAEDLHLSYIPRHV